MKTIDVKDAATKFDRMLELVEDGPLHLQDNGKDVAVVMAIAEYEALAGTPNPDRVRPIIKTLLVESMQRHRAVYEALTRYEAEHPEDSSKQ